MFERACVYTIHLILLHVIFLLVVVVLRCECVVGEAKINSLGQAENAPIYISADATNKASLAKAYEQIKEKHTTINGILHSAIVLKDQTILAMDEGKFKASLSAKVDISVNIENVFGSKNLDFILFFSSLTSFAKAAGQSNYAAGCTFKDSFSQYLAQNKSYAVKTINWGYWGNIGIVADKFYKDRMEQMGIGSIEPEEGMEALEILVGSELNQMALHKIKSINKGSFCSCTAN